jgi:putative NADPH-quinone reductase
MKKLIIIAQPSKKWFLWELANFYKDKALEAWDDIQVLDLYEKKNFQPNLEFEDMKVLNPDPNREKFYRYKFLSRFCI